MNSSALINYAWLHLKYVTESKTLSNCKNTKNVNVKTFYVMSSSAPSRIKSSYRIKWLQRKYWTLTRWFVYTFKKRVWKAPKPNRAQNRLIKILHSFSRLTFLYKKNAPFSINKSNKRLRVREGQRMWQRSSRCCPPVNKIPFEGGVKVDAISSFPTTTRGCVEF